MSEGKSCARASLRARSAALAVQPWHPFRAVHHVGAPRATPRWVSDARVEKATMASRAGEDANRRHDFGMGLSDWTATAWRTAGKCGISTTLPRPLAPRCPVLPLHEPVLVRRPALGRHRRFPPAKAGTTNAPLLVMRCDAGIVGSPQGRGNRRSVGTPWKASLHLFARRGGSPRLASSFARCVFAAGCGQGFLNMILNLTCFDKWR